MKQRILLGSLSVLLLFTSILSILPQSVSADINSDAKAFCKTAKFSNNQDLSASYQIDCQSGYFQASKYLTAKKPPTSAQETNYCQHPPFLSSLSQGACTIGWNGAVNRQSSIPGGSGSGGNGSAGTNDTTAATICAPHYGGNDLQTCTQAIQAECAGWAGQVANMSACVKGAVNGAGGKSNPCSSYKDKQKTACETAFQTTNTSSSSSSNGNSATQTTCDTSGFSLSWVFCSVISGLADFVNGVFKDLIDPLLVIDSNKLLDPSKPFYTVWSNFRIYGDIFLVIALLVIVFGESIGGGMIDAYTAKKVLPRLLLAAVLINLSIYLVGLALDLTNIVGKGIYSLITLPFNTGVPHGLTLNISGQSAVFGTGAVLAGALWVHATGGIMHFLLTGILGPAALIIIVTLLTLIIRQALIYLLVFVSPIAFALYCLPNTEQYFRKWWNLLFKSLMIYPIIGAIFAISNVLSYTLGQSGGSLAQVISLAALFAPLIMVPFAFRFAGGVLGQLHQAAHSKIAQPGLDRLRKTRADRRAQNIQALKAGERWNSNNFIGDRLNRASRGIANVPSAGITPWKMRSRYQAGMAGHTKTALAEYMEKNAEWKAIQGNDDYLQATMKNMGGGDNETDWRRYLSAHGYEGRSLEQGVAMIRAAKGGTNGHVFKAAAVIANSSTGTGWKEGGAGQMMESINEAAGGDRDLAAGMLADMRQRATQSRRIDLAGAGFGGQIRDLNAMQDGSMDATQATERNNRKVLELQGAGAIAQSRGDSMKLLAPAMMEEMRTAYASGNDVTIKRTLAKAANMYDTISYASPENAELFADQVLAQPLDGGPQLTQEPVTETFYNYQSGRNEKRQALDASGNPIMRTAQVTDNNGAPVFKTLRSEIESYRSDPEFRNMRRELNVQEATARNASSTLGGGAPPVVPPPAA